MVNVPVKKTGGPSSRVQDLGLADGSSASFLRLESEKQLVSKPEDLSPITRQRFNQAGPGSSALELGLHVQTLGLRILRAPAAAAPWRQAPCALEKQEFVPDA